MTKGLSQISASIEDIRRASAVIDSAWQEVHLVGTSAQTVMALDEASAALHRAVLALDLLATGNLQIVADAAP